MAVVRKSGRRMAEVGIFILKSEGKIKAGVASSLSGMLDMRESS